MKPYIFLFAICFFIVTSCKSKKEASASTTTNKEQSVVKGKTLGKVSHQYSVTGCATVVIVKIEGQEKPLTLIPKDKLSSSFDVDGLEILFNYRPLKRIQPAGCNVGAPAELADITKK